MSGWRCASCGQEGVGRPDATRPEPRCPRCGASWRDFVRDPLALPRALTLTQPWASLVMAGAKALETRSWSTRHRGLLVIHASREVDGRAYDRLWGALARNSLADAALPTGAALGTVMLEDVFTTGPALDPFLAVPERELGDFSPGRYAWALADPRPFLEPVPWRGAQGVWRYAGPLPFAADLWEGEPDPETTFERLYMNRPIQERPG